MYKVLPKLKAGTPEKPVTLRGGLVGITFGNPDVFSESPTINTVAPESSALKAGLKTGDIVLEVDGQAIHNQAQVLHHLRPKYEGETVSFKVRRGKDEMEFKDMVLQGTQQSIEGGFLGILPSATTRSRASKSATSTRGRRPTSPS